MHFRSLATLVLAILSFHIGCSSGTSGGGNGGGSPSTGNPTCTADYQCEGTLVCNSKGSCVAPPSSGSDGSGPTGGSSPVCKTADEACDFTSDCCGYNTYDAYCADDGAGFRCHPTCTSPSDCPSGCCAELENGDAICAAAEVCGVCNAQPGDPCSVQSDCCGNDTYDAFCVTDDSGARCHSACVLDSDCNSGCCVDLDSGEAVCAPAKYCG